MLMQSLKDLPLNNITEPTLIITIDKKKDAETMQWRLGEFLREYELTGRFLIQLKRAPNRYWQLFLVPNKTPELTEGQ